MKYRADIDGLRTVAVLLVLVFHFDLLSVGKAGFIGVDIFFVISGFLITSIIRTDLENGQFHFGTFLYRRVRRLYPALLATLVLTLIAGWFLFLPFRFAELAYETLMSLLYVVNFYFWQNINYFDLRADGVPLLHMWSLAVEEQFYFLFPLACWIIWRVIPRLLVPAVTVALVISLGLSLYFTPLKPELSFYLLPTRAWELLVGSLLALLVHNRNVDGKWLLIFGPLGAAVIIASIFAYGPLTQVPGWFALLPTLGTAAVILGGFATQAPMTRLMSLPLMVWIGKISYPLYLVHWPIRIFLQEHLEEFTFGWRLFGFILSFGLAALIYVLIETPVRRGSVLPRRGVFVGLVVAMSTALVVMSFQIHSSGGVASRFPQEVSEILAVRDDQSMERRACTNAAAAQSDRCRLGDSTAPPRVLILGDSHALALAGAMDGWLIAQGRAGMLLYNHGCMPVQGAGLDQCQANFNAALTFAEDQAQVEEIVMISIWRQGIPDGGKPFNGRWVPEDEVAEVFQSHLEDTVERLRRAGKQITIIEPLFAAQASVPTRLANNIAFNRNRPIDRPLSEHEATFSTVLAAMDRVNTDGVRSLSLIGPLCEGGLCRAVVDGRPLFSDSNHLAYSQSARIAQTLIELTGKEQR